MAAILPELLSAHGGIANDRLKMWSSLLSGQNFSFQSPNLGVNSNTLGLDTQLFLIVSQDEYFFKAYNKIGTLCTCTDSFYNFLFLHWGKNQTQSFSLLPWNYLLILKIVPVTSFKDSKAAILTMKKWLQEVACDSVKSYRKPPVTNKFLRIFFAANERSALENIDQSQRKEIWGGLH